MKFKIKCNNDIILMKTCPYDCVEDGRVCDHLSITIER